MQCNTQLWSYKSCHGNGNTTTMKETVAAVSQTHTDRGFAKWVGCSSPARITKMFGLSSTWVMFVNSLDLFTSTLRTDSVVVWDLRWPLEHASTSNTTPITTKMGTSPPYKNESEELPLHRNLPSPLLPIVSFIYLLNQVLPLTFCVLDFSSSNEVF